MNRSLLCIVIVVCAACATHDADPAGEWGFEDPPDEEAPAPEASPLPEATPDEPDVEPTPDRTCPTPDLRHWDPEEFDLELFRYFSCIHPPNQNVLFSPALARQTLIEFAEDQGGAEGEEIALLLGYPNLREATAAIAAYRASLLARRPRAAEGLRMHDLRRVEYSIPDVADDRLQEALSVEFFSPDCQAGECSFVPDHERWSETFLDELPPPGDDTHRAIVLRGQWEYDGVRYTPRGFDFQVTQAGVIPTRRILQRTQRAARTEDLWLLELPLVGGEVSVFLLWSELTPDQILQGLTTAELKELISGIDEPPSYPHIVHFPEFDLSQTLEIGVPLNLPQHLPIAGRVSADTDGLTFPSPLVLDSKIEESSGNQHLLGQSREGAEFRDPFLFIVYDHPTESILYLGRVARPVRFSDPDDFWAK